MKKILNLTAKFMIQNKKHIDALRAIESGKGLVPKGPRCVGQFFYQDKMKAMQRIAREALSGSEPVALPSPESVENMETRVRELTALINPLQRERAELEQKILEANSPFKVGDTIEWEAMSGKKFTGAASKT